MNWWPALAGAAAGAIIGSYLATLCLRWPNAEQATIGRSRCDHCDRFLQVRDLLPVISFIISRGRCRYCGGPIDPFHLEVELASAAIGGAALALFPGLEGAALAIFGWLLLTPAILDARHLWLPDRLTLALSLGGIVIGWQLSAVPLQHRMIGGLAGFLSLWLVALAYRHWRGRDGLGAGDPKLLGAIGLWTGWAALPTILLMAAMAGLLVAIVRRTPLAGTLPFGAMLSAAAFLWAGGALIPD